MKNWRFWAPDAPVRSYYFLGKDNIFHHTILWPGILAGHGGLLLPYDVPANEWLRVDGGKISKSGPTDRSIVLPELLARYPPDVIRFYAAQLAPQNHDTELSWSEFHQLSEDVLSNQYGNLVQRILVLVRERCAGRVPSPPPGWTADGPGGLGERLKAAHAAIEKEFEAVHLKEALELALTEVREANRRFHEAKPWQAREAERDRALYEGLWAVQAVATWLAPFLPFSSAEVYRMLGLPHLPGPGDWANAVTPPSPGQALGEVRPLFPRREASASPPAAPPAAPSEQSPGGSSALDVRVAVVRGVEDHPSADRLYVLRIDVGELGERTLVAGVRPFYPKEELLGRSIVVLANLAPRTIRRITSQGMLLAADDGEKAVLLQPPEGATAGVRLLGGDTPAASVDYAAFEASPMVIGVVEGPEGSDGTLVAVGGRTVTVPGRFPTGASLVVRLASPTAESGVALTEPGGRPVTPSRELPAGTRVR